MAGSTIHQQEGRKVAGLARRVRGWLLLSVALGGLSAVCLVVVFVGLAQLVDNAAFHGQVPSLSTQWVWVLLGCLAATITTQFLSDMAGTQAGLRVVSSVRQDALEHLAKAGPVATSRLPAGEVLTLLSDGVEALEPYFARYMPAAARMVVQPLLILAVVAGVDGWSLLILLCTGPLVPVFMVLVGYRAQALMDQQWVRMTLLGGGFLDALRGLKTLRLFGRTADSLERIARMADAHRKVTLSVMKVAFLTSASLEFFASLSIAMVAVVFGTRLLAGTADFRSAFLVLLLAPEYFMPLRNFSASYHARQNALASMTRLMDIFALPISPRQAEEGAQPLQSEAADKLCCDSVFASYDGQTAVLQNVTCCFARNRLTVLEGASGAGKSSLLAVVLGFLQPSAGHVAAYGRNGQALCVAGLRMAWVPQRPLLVFGTVADNLRLGAPDADTEALRRVAAQADALSFIMALPQGFDTPLGERGSKLSGGQVRRLALARALLRDPDVLVLDEPTAGLDPASALRVADAIRGCTIGRIVIAATHHSALTARADTVLHVSGGRVVQAPMPAVETVA
ncbi:thiol reductant ABC exporter subunit CydD [Acetobacter vaccinii]|uniref:Thiol reductant ABC exporter subunit CydD n=1 Tax=Acetobacter vaccinii TaxID=2592655 RepID=A0A5C1YRQ4_9PROT|nr:thiol reductant ABC exporter subunit CydD [Acetobacter vaccinii]QEO17780.1 thiol reductant ABC exporter subunit CydD [Acetobacter vaccinii]